MDIDTKKHSRKDRPGQNTSLKPFIRLLGYVWKQKRYLFPALGCIMFMAATYSASLGSILPILTVLIRPQGLHGSVDQYVTEKRLNCTIGVYNPVRDQEFPGIKARTAQFRVIPPSSPLRNGTTKLDGNEFILAVNDKEGTAVDVLPILAEATTLRIRFIDPTHGPNSQPQETVVTAKPAKFYHTALRRALAYLPGGVEPHQRWRTLLIVLGLLGVVVTLGNIARFSAEYLACIVNCRTIMDVRRHLYAQVLRLPLSHFSRNATDTLSRFAQDTQEIFRGLLNFFEKIVTEPFKALGALCVALAVDWRLTIMVMVAAPIALAVIRKLGKRIRRSNRKLLMTYSQILGALESTLTGMRVVKAYNGEHYERRRLFSMDRRALGHQLKMGRTEALASPFLEMLGFGAVVVAILYFGHSILTEGVEEEIPGFLALVVCMAAVFDPIRKLTTVYPKIQRASAAADRVFEVLDRPNEFSQDTGKPRVRPLKDTIVFENVGYTYPESNRPALRDINLTVKKGEIIALVGPNGSGKTTLVSLLPRFFPIGQGRILFDGQDINEVSLRSLREQFSLIAQESVIFPDTVRANIAYGLPTATDAEVRAAAEKAFADEFIRQMPEGYDTVVGEHGATLSGGQRPRIAIARAILRNAPILIFDEATAQVDPESEMKIHAALESFLKGRTAFVIAHRYSTVRNADRIVVMNDGQIVAVGPHDELLTTCPLYSRLYEAQFKSNGGSAEENA
ncbi:MAG: ABC transporter ATP-binding protein [Phycisphaerae bacterium]|nr:ABC transporter ATP-binding protein [Phycisphaerae bacterium]